MVLVAAGNALLRGWLGWLFIDRVGVGAHADGAARTVATLGLAALATAAIGVPLLMATDSEAAAVKPAAAIAALALLTAPIAGWWSRGRALATADAPTARMGTLSLAGGLVLIAETLLALALALEIASHLS